MDDLTVIVGADGDALAAAMALRQRVFIDEQRVPKDLERDEHDATAHHVVLLRGAVAVGTGRVRLIHDADGVVAKVERVAVDRAERRTGLGRRVMAALEARARDLGARRVTLAAQQSAVPFYERLGYLARGGPFMDAGIVHYWMDRIV